MTVHPQCQAILDAVGDAGFDLGDPVEARRLYRISIDIYAPPTPALRAVENRVLDGVPVRIYTPVSEANPLPVLVFAHGGGWVFGDLDTHDALCRALADAADCLIVSVDYRLAPEHKFPAGLEDVMAVLRWTAAYAGELGGDPARIAVGGDSAGGNLAAAATHLARDAGGPPIAFQLLIYPATDFTALTEGPRRNGEGFLLTDIAIATMQDRYLSDPAQMRDPRVSPLLAKDFSGLPPALLLTAQFDPLKAEGQAYADALEAAGVAVQTIDYPGMIHGFIRMGALVDDAATAIDDAAKALRRAFGR